MDRRQFLSCAGAFAAEGSMHRLAAAPVAPGIRFIDVHHHYTPPAFKEFTKRFNPEGGTPPFGWDLASDLRDMDESRTALAVLSGFTPTNGGTVQDRAKLARETNEFGARLVTDHPNRFALFATLPIPDIGGSLQEVAYGIDVLGAVGVTIYTDAEGKWLGDPLFDELYTELNQRKAVVFVHPHSPSCCLNLVPKVPDSIVEYAAATTRTIASLIFSGTTVRFPYIRFSFSHGGGAMPFLIERFLADTQAEIVPGVMTRGQPRVPITQPPGTALAELRKMYFDTAQINNPVALQALRSVVGVSQILYGTDEWYRTAADSSRGLLTSGVFTPKELESVALRNALRLLPSLQGKLLRP